MCLTPPSEWYTGIWKTSYMTKPPGGSFLIRFLAHVDKKSWVNMSIKSYKYQLNLFSLTDGSCYFLNHFRACKCFYKNKPYRKQVLFHYLFTCSLFSSIFLVTFLMVNGRGGSLLHKSILKCMQQLLISNATLLVKFSPWIFILEIGCNFRASGSYFKAKFTKSWKARQQFLLG